MSWYNHFWTRYANHELIWKKNITLSTPTSCFSNQMKILKNAPCEIFWYLLVWLSRPEVHPKPVEKVLSIFILTASIKYCVGERMRVGVISLLHEIPSFHHNFWTMSKNALLPLKLLRIKSSLQKTPDFYISGINNSSYRAWKVWWYLKPWSLEH